MLDLDEILSGIRAAPELTGAKCVGHARLFDSADADDVAACIEACHHCPALTACTTWLAALPPRQRPRGVVAGRIVAPPKRRQAKPKPPRSTMRQRALAAMAAHEAAVARTGAVKAAAPRSAPGRHWPRRARREA